MNAYTEITPKGTEKVWDDNDTIKNEFQSHKECEQHYYSAKQSTTELKIRLDAYQNKYGYNFEAPPWTGAPTTPNPGTGSEQHFTKQMIWKPNGNTKTPVFVMDKRYTQGGQDDAPSLLTGPVVVYAASGAKVEDLRYGSSGNGGRGNWRSGKKVADLMPHAPLTLRWMFQGKEEYIIVPNPSKRYDPNESSVDE